jgi:solute carrier family 25 protein 43
VHHAQDIRITIPQAFISGGIAGVVARSVTSPLDVVKIMAQVGTKPSRGGLFSSFRHLYQTEGIRSFWKGNGMACLRLFPYNALQFAFFEQFKRWISDQSTQTRRLTWMDSLVAGSLAGMCATLITHPADMVKTRLTVMHADPSIAKYKVRHPFRVDAYLPIFILLACVARVFSMHFEPLLAKKP